MGNEYTCMLTVDQLLATFKSGLESSALSNLIPQLTILFASTSHNPIVYIFTFNLSASVFLIHTAHFHNAFL